MKKTIEFWNDEVEKIKELHHPRWFLYYLDRLTMEAVEIGLESLKDRRGLLLKTDLWNEGVEYSRNVLRKIYNYKSFDLDLYGIDVSDKICISAKKLNPFVNAFQADIRSLPFKDNSLDIILDLSTLDHIPLSSVPNVLKGYSRILKENGILVLIFWYGNLTLKFILKFKKMKCKLQFFFPINIIKREIRKNFSILKEYRVGAISHVNGLGILKYLLSPFPESFFDLIVKIDYSKFSKYFLQFPLGYYVIIARKR